MNGIAPATEPAAPPPLAVVLSTAPDEGTALALARALVDERLAACVNVVPGVTSVYRWEGAVQAEREWLLVMKTRRALLDRLSARVSELHPYGVPEVVSAPIEHGLEAYLRWVAEETAPATPGGTGGGDPPRLSNLEG